ncbi:unnamed protein product [Rhodiola kirilowii]
MVDAAAGNARLLRCPKCKNLLRDLTGYSLFKCGGCGALLGAERNYVNPTTSVEKSEEEITRGVYPMSNNLSDKGKDYFTGASEMDEKASVAEFKDVVGDQDIVRAVSPERIHNFSEVVNNSRLKGHLDAKKERNDIRCFEESKPHPGSEKEGTEKMLKYRSDGVLLTSSNFPEEGPSDYTYKYNYDYTSHVDSGMQNKYLEGSRRVDHLEQDKRELLRKLEELNNQLSWSGGQGGTLKKKAILGRDLSPNEPYGIADGWLSDNCPVMSKDSKQTFVDDKNIGRPLYFANYPDSYPYANQHGPYMQSSYNHTHLQKDTLSYGNGFESQMPRRPATSGSSKYFHHQNFPSYHPGQYIDADPDTFEPYQHNALLHRPTCSCFHCYNKHQNIIPPIPHSNFHDGRFVNRLSNPMYYHQNHANSLVPGDYDFRVTRGPSSFYDPMTRTRGDVHFNTRVGSHESRRPCRIILNKGGRHCYPLVGGAPFMTCHNCFELLQLPIKLLKLEGHQQKLRCGACSRLIYYYFHEKKLLIYEHRELKNDGDSSELMDGRISNSIGSTIRTDTKFNSDDFDSSGNDFKLFDEEPALPATYCNMNTNKTVDTNLTVSASVSPSSTEEECSQLNLKAQRELHCSIDFPENSSSTAPPPGSPLQDHFDYSSSNHTVNRYGKGDQSRRSDLEKVMPKVVSSDQNFLSEVSEATETEISFNEYPNSGISQDSKDGGKEVHHLQINRKDGFAGILKKSFKEISKHNQGVDGEKTCVTINGHPLSDRIIKKAAKRAGRIQPGNYWYDIRAGFWGVMGGPCLGIIPPYIEEFNYPLSENCSGGATSVFVNGRELHEKDLELLSLRGLPTTRDRSYIVEISGKVLEEGSGKELDSLGRLARTVEKAKHGFGMKVPKQIVVNKIEQ